MVRWLLPAAFCSGLFVFVAHRTPRCGTFPWSVEELAAEMLDPRFVPAHHLKGREADRVRILAWQAHGGSRPDRVLFLMEFVPPAGERVWLLQAAYREGDERWKSPSSCGTGQVGCRFLTAPPGEEEILAFCNQLVPVSRDVFFDPKVTTRFDCDAWRAVTGKAPPTSLPESGWDTGSDDVFVF